MLVTSVEKYDKKRSRVFIDYEFAFLLYNSELCSYGIAQDGELSREIYEKIMQEVVIKRAKQRALDILKRSDKSETMLRRKLRDSHFCDCAIEAAVCYINSYNYLDDERYARNFYCANCDRKSYREIVMLLKNNGIEADVLERALAAVTAETDALEAEAAAVKKLLTKKGFDTEALHDYREKCKIMQSLYRKGFSEEAIRRAINTV